MYNRNQIIYGDVLKKFNKIESKIKINCIIDYLIIIEIIQITKKAQESIKNVEIWKK